MRCQEVPVMELSYTVTVLHICVHKYTKGLRTKHKHKKECENSEPEESQPAA